MWPAIAALNQIKLADVTLQGKVYEPCVIGQGRLPNLELAKAECLEKRGGRVAARLTLCAVRFLACAAIMCLAFSTSVRAQTDEIQVYDGQIAAPGSFNLTLHNNYTPSGHMEATDPGGIASNHTLNGVAEWAYGVAPWFEAGLYLPLYSISGDGSVTFNGFKLRTLFVLPDAADQSFFYGVNFEFSRNAAHWNPNPNTQEIRPIIGWRLGSVEFIVNPILDNSWKGFSQLDFAPATRLAYNFNKIWAIAAEEYADFGALRKFLPPSQQQHQLFGVFDFNGKSWLVEGGVGFGLTDASDRLVLKLILQHDLN